MSLPIITELESYCHEILRQGEGLLRWEWDSRFKAVAASFSAPELTDVLKVVEPLFLSRWDENTVTEAPLEIQDLAEHMGGLRSNQVLYTSTTGRELLVFGALWPWGGGDPVSFRIGYFNVNIPDTKDSDFEKTFKAWFGL